MNFLITGGASGLGLAITRSIAQNHPGAKIYFTFFSALQRKEELEKEFSNTTGISCNFFIEEDITNLIKIIEENDIDVLINNAVTGLTKQYFHKTEDELILKSFEADVLSTIRITKAFIVKARKRRYGKIITILSALINTPPVGLCVYLANKNYLLSMHKSWVAENKGFNITSNCVSPEFMNTALDGDVDERVIENMIVKHPLKKLLTVDEVAEVVLFLCNSSPQLNGQNIILNAAQY